MDIQKKDCKVGMLKWKQDSVTLQSTTTSIAWTDTLGQAENKAKRRMRYPSKAELWLSSGSEIVREREQELMIAGGSPKQDEQQTYPSFSLSSHLDGWWTSSWWDKSWPWIGNGLHDGFCHSSSDSDDHYKRTSERRVNTHTSQTTFVSSCTSSFCHSAIVIVQVRILAFARSFSSRVSAWCFAHRHSERKVVVCPYHTPYTALRAHSLVATDRYIFHTLWDQVQFNGSEQCIVKKRSSHADATRRKAHKQFDDQFISSIYVSIFRSVLWYCGNVEFAGEASGICRQREFRADALYGLGEYENIFLRLEPQELSIRNNISE